jgi:cytoskeleton protein RodZ
MKADSQEAFSDLRHDEAAVMSPGALLRDRRLALNLNEWDIAREMRLQTQYILDLEADNFDAFSSLAFVRGYLRGYAKLVGVSEIDVMQLFNQLSLQDKVATGVPRYITHDKNSGDRYWRWMGLGVIASISLVLWWQNYNSNIKTLNTSVDTTLSQVSTLQKTLQAENAPAQTQTTPATPTPDQVGGALGASADLLNNSVPNPTVPAGTTAIQNTAVAPAVPTTVVPANNANSAATMPTAAPITMAPASNTTAASTSVTTANSTAATNTTTPVAQPAKRKNTQSNLSSAHAPIVDGQAPRLGDN